MDITGTTLLLFAVFFILLGLSVPISISILISSFVTALATLPFEQVVFIIMQKMNSGIESFNLLAVPLFILAGNIMNNGGIARRLVNFAQAFVGRIPGSLAQANILGNILNKFEISKNNSNYYNVYYDKHCIKNSLIFLYHITTL